MLRIESPSKVFEDIAKWVVEGFDKGMNAFGINSEGEVEQFAEKSKGILSELFDSLNEQFPIFSKLKAGFVTLISAIAGLAILIPVGKALFDFGNQSQQTVLQLESVSLAFRSVSDSADQAASRLEFADKTAQKLGISLDIAWMPMSSY